MLDTRRIDLHCHSTASDGSLAPAALVRMAKRVGLSALALTDHDTVGGVAEAMQAGVELGVEVVSGVELSVRSGDMGVDLLAYLFDPEDAALQAALRRLADARMDRAPRMVAKLAVAGYDIDLDDVLANAGGTVGRPHVAKALVDAGHASDTDDAFKRLIGRDGPGYVGKDRLDAREGIRVVRAAGGVTVLAHPVFIPPQWRASAIKHLAELGIDGVEVHYSRHTPEVMESVRALASIHGLVHGGGSDFHGDSKPDIALGTGMGDLQVPYRVLEDLRVRAKRRP